MKKRLTKSAIFGVILAFFVPLTVLAESDVKEPKEAICAKGSHGKGPGIEKLIENLGLTPEQVVKLKEQKGAHRQNTMQTAKELKAKRQELKEELAKEEVNKDSINSIIAQISELQSSLLYQRIQGVLTMKEILTPEQFEKFQSFHEHNMKKSFNKQGRRFHVPKDAA